jgi:hypothetical protein
VLRRTLTRLPFDEQPALSHCSKSKARGCRKIIPALMP